MYFHIFSLKTMHPCLEGIYLCVKEHVKYCITNKTVRDLYGFYAIVLHFRSTYNYSVCINCKIEYTLYSPFYIPYSLHNMCRPVVRTRKVNSLEFFKTGSKFFTADTRSLFSDFRSSVRMFALNSFTGKYYAWLCNLAYKIS